MKINQEKPILVTGGSGYIASWIIHLLLTKGLNVRATVRSKSNLEKVEHLISYAKANKAKLELFEADLLEEGSFKNAIAGCELIMHTASPFFKSKPKDPWKELINPALKGTENILKETMNNSGVKRIVLSSSVAAIYSDAIDIKSRPGKIFNEKQWNENSSEKHNPYHFSKTLAEKKAWELFDSQKDWDLVVINPAFVLGPSLSKRLDSESVHFMKSMVDGSFAKGLPENYLGIVDVRDVAQSHINAGFFPGAQGRHICCAEAMSLIQIADLLKQIYPKQFPIPEQKISKQIFYELSPEKTGLSKDWVNKNYGIPIKFDNSKIQKELAIQFRPIKQTFKDHVQQLYDAGYLKNSTLKNDL